jgi:DhnA family fructose-bisphosphate aldolase class Ia
VLYVALGADDERPMIERLARVGEAAERHGIPFIAEAEWPSAYSSLDDVSELGTDYLLRSVRLCAELGADVVKTNWPGSEDEFGQLVEAATGLPVVLAGGSRITDEELLSRQEVAMRAGAVGCSVGRNIFMHDRPEAITRALRRVIVDRWRAAQALEELAGAPV